jgi:hypothetical protein
MWVITIKQNMNLKFEPPCRFVFLVFYKDGLNKSCLFFWGSISTQNCIIWSHIDWCQFCTHLRNLNICHLEWSKLRDYRSWCQDLLQWRDCPTKVCEDWSVHNLRRGAHIQTDRQHFDRILWCWQRGGEAFGSLFRPNCTTSLRSAVHINWETAHQVPCYMEPWGNRRPCPETLQPNFDLRCNVSRGSSGSIVSDCGLDGRGSILSRGKGFSSSLCVQTGSGAHPASCTMGTGGPFLGVKRGLSVTPTADPNLVPRSWMSRNYTCYPPDPP